MSAPSNSASGMRKTHHKVKELLTGRPVAPNGTDVTGYEDIIQFIIDHNVLAAEGDLIEIGTFLGGGAYKLSKTVEKKSPTKKVYVIDLFQPEVDHTVNANGDSMSNLYANTLGEYQGMSQRQVFDNVTRGCQNIVVIDQDSKQVKLPADSVCFAFIDGNHDPDYVVSDFEMLWSKVSSGGAVGFHDYNHDLPQTTEAINTLKQKHQDKIAKVVEDANKHIVYFIHS